MADKMQALVVGGGPAGLMAAEVLAEGGASVVLTDAMPSVGRKFLMAGKSGLNLTREEPPERFAARYSDVSPAVDEAVAAFGAEEVQRWTKDLGEPLFTGTTGRVFPTAMKASPLLRRWLARLDALGVERRVRWRWTGWEGNACTFETPDGPRAITPSVTILSLGGGSWRRLGSDGAWQAILGAEGIPTTPFVPSNVGLNVAWSDHMSPHFGAPVKGTELRAGRLRSRGEWVITERGIEGGGVYDISRAARDGTPVSVDLLPDLSKEEIAHRLGRPRGKASFANHLRKTLRLDGQRRALLMEFARPFPHGPEALAARLKSLPIRTTGPLPLDEAISTGGGVAWEALDGFALRARPDTFCAGEMLPWDAPTGGYLLTACFATGRTAARAALERL